MAFEVNVRYKDQEWPVTLGGMSTVKDILLASLINNGLPVSAHEKFALHFQDGREVSDSSGNAIFAGVMDGDTLELRFNK